MEEKKLVQEAVLVEKVERFKQKLVGLKEGGKAYLKWVDLLQEAEEHLEKLRRIEVLEPEYHNQESEAVPMKQGTVVQAEVPFYVLKEGKFIEDGKMEVFLTWGAEMLFEFENEPKLGKLGYLKLLPFTEKQLKGFIGTCILTRVHGEERTAFRFKIGRNYIRTSKVRALVPSQSWDWRPFYMASGYETQRVIELLAYSLHRAVNTNVVVETGMVNAIYVKYGLRWMTLVEAEKIYESMKAKQK